MNRRGKKQERYFRLYGTTLSWYKSITVRFACWHLFSVSFFFFFFFDISHGYASQDKVTLGTLDVTTLTLDVRPHELTLILRGSKRGKEKEWLLMGPNEFVLLSWHNAIVNAQNPQQSDVRASLLGTYLHSPPTPRAEELPVGMAHSEEETLLGSPEGQYHILLQQGTSKFFC
jgi:hypothetical protein